MKLQKHTIGLGDRFAHQGKAQLRAVQRACDAGLEIYPVWNKSNREHALIGSRPGDLRAEADAAVQTLGWTGAYYVDADHIGLQTVDAFLVASDFYTLDVADFTGKPAAADDIDGFTAAMGRYVGPLAIPGIDAPFTLTTELVRTAAEKFLLAVQEAGRIHRHIEGKLGRDRFVAELSVDETDARQTPVELFLILAMVAREGIPVQTIAPKFTGRFNKGVDYVGDLTCFAREFDEDLSVLAFAVEEFGLPATLKLSVHSGSDKFSLYPIINRLLKKHDAGVHLKTAGTTWLEEVIGLAEAGGEGLAIAMDIYAGAYARFNELTRPYAAVIDIWRDGLPSPDTVRGWESARFVNTLRHDQSHPDYHPQFRQLVHVGFKVAAEMDARFTDALKTHEETVARNVTANLFERHLLPLFS